MIGLRALYDYECPFCKEEAMVDPVDKFVYKNIKWPFLKNIFCMWPHAGVVQGKTICSIVGCKKHG